MNEHNKRPKLTKCDAIELVKNKYGLIVKQIVELNGYDDRNYKIEVETSINNPYIKEMWPYGYVLKVINEEDSKNFKLIEAQNCLMLHLKKHNFNVPIPVLNIDGENCSLEQLDSNQAITYAVKLLTFLPGQLLNDNQPSHQLYKNVGTYLAEVDLALQSFHHEAYDKLKSVWDLGNLCASRKYLYLIEKDVDKFQMVKQHIDNFESYVLPEINKLETGIIHSDFNEHNLITNTEHVQALLDFGDAHRSPYLFEIAICICYVLIHSKEIKYGGDVINGYQQRRKLTNIEAKLLKLCVCGRLCQSLVNGLYFYEIYKNDYVLSSHTIGWQVLKQLTNCEDEKLKDIWNLEYC